MADEENAMLKRGEALDIYQAKFDKSKIINYYFFANFFYYF